MDLIQLTQNGASLVLHGAEMAAPFIGATYNPSSGALDTVSETLDLLLEGSAAEIETAMRALGRLLEPVPGAPAGSETYLEARAASGGETWRSPLVRGWMELGPAGADQRREGVQLLKLHITRQNWWEGAETWLPLYNDTGGPVSSGLAIRNHWDGDVLGHQNFVELRAADSAGSTAGDLPAPLKLDFRGTGTNFTGTLYAAQNIYSSPLTMRPVLEGEFGEPGNGAALSMVSDATCSNGAFGRVTWSGEAETAVWKCSMTAAIVVDFNGRPLLPVVRLANPLPAGSKFWHYWRVTLNANVSAPEGVHDCAGSYLGAPAMLNPGSPLILPPWVIAPGDSPEGVGLELRVAAAGTGSHTLDIDYVYLLPLDGWRIYRPALKNWNAGLYVLDDPYARVLKSADWDIQTHTAEGPGLWVQPGMAARYYFLMERQGGAGFAPATAASVRLAYRPRKRTL